mgnify:CR=1 FL=1
MSVNKFEIHIEGKNVSLENMSLDAAKALKTLVEAFTKLAELQKNPEDYKISLNKGSSKVSIDSETEQMEVLENQIQEVAENKSKNKEVIDTLNIIHDTVLIKGLKFNISLTKKGVNKNYTDVFNRDKKFTKKRSERRKTKFTLKFFTGRLFNVGGNSPNIHVEINQSEKKTIKCSEADAIKIVKYIYSDVLVSVWDDNKTATGKDNSYELCDYYTNGSEKIYQTYIAKINGLNHNDCLKFIYSEIESLIVNSEFKKINKFIRLFNHKSIHVEYLRMILVATKPIKDNEEISLVRSLIKEKCESIIGKIF